MPGPSCRLPRTLSAPDQPDGRPQPLLKDQVVDRPQPLLRDQPDGRPRLLLNDEPAGRPQPLLTDQPVERPRPMLKLPMPEGVLVAIPHQAAAMVCPESPQFSSAESEGPGSATDSEAPPPAPSSAEPAGGDGHTPQSPDAPDARPLQCSPVNVKSEVCSVYQGSPQLFPSPDAGPTRAASQTPLARLMTEMGEDERVSVHSEPVLPRPRGVAAADPRRPESAPILPPRRLSFEFEPPSPPAAGPDAPTPGIPAGEPTPAERAGGGSAPDELQLRAVRRRLERLAAQTAAGTGTPRAEAAGSASSAGRLAAAVREAAAAADDTGEALAPILAELLAEPELAADLFQGLCAELIGRCRSMLDVSDV